MFKKFIIKEDSSKVEKFSLKEFSLRVTKEAESFEKSELISKKGFEINKNSSKKSGLSYLKDKRIANEITSKVDELLEVEKIKFMKIIKQKVTKRALRLELKKEKNQ